MHKAVHFLFEVGFLKNVDRTGWWLPWNRSPESVAEHSFRCAIIGYILAKSEVIDASRVIMMCTFHDVHETRINNLHKITQHYIGLEKGRRTSNQRTIRTIKGFGERRDRSYITGVNTSGK